MSATKDKLPEDLAAATRVLIVDNDNAHARSMGESLERSGYPVTVATTGPEGAEAIERGSFDVVVTAGGPPVPPAEPQHFAHVAARFNRYELRGGAHARGAG